MSLYNLFSKLKGGSGSGNFGHGGRIGKIGGSSVGGIRGEPKTPPPPGEVFNPNVKSDKDGDGITDVCRVGIPAYEIPPPPPIGRLPNLTPDERQVESDFIKAYEKDPDAMADNFLTIVKASGDPPTFGTDDAKVLTNKWSDPNMSLEDRSINRAIYNTPLHQTSNAISKRAFVKHLDTLKTGDEILVTAGGVGAGKGYALKNVPDALAMKQRSKAVWDSAGDQNATENPWIQKQAEARGLKVNYVYVHANPRDQWANPQRGVVQRASNPNDGRMVDSKVFADSYDIGAKNHQAFVNANKNNPNTIFSFIDNTGKPKRMSGIPQQALKVNSNELNKFAVDSVNKSNAPAHVKRGATIGSRIWGNK